MFISLLITSAGCDALDACTDAGCGDATPIFVTGPQGAALEDGIYELELSLDDDGFSFVCDMSQPNTSCQTDDAGAPQAVIDGKGRIQVSFVGTPSSYDLIVEPPMGEPVVETGTFTYDESRPNGPDCEPVCRTPVEDYFVEVS